MICTNYNNKYPVSFGTRIKLSDKGLLNLPQKTELLYTSSPFDFFYKESKGKKRLDALSIRIKERIRKEQQKPGNTRLKQYLLNKSYSAANRLRTAASKLLIFENIKGFYNSFKLVKKLQPSAPEYIEEWAKIGNSIHNKYINVNIEDGHIEKLAKSGEAVIFILNHDNFERDKFMYPIFNSFLNYAYSSFGKQKDCPRPKILVSRNFVSLVGSKYRSIYRKMGLVPVDASMTNRKADKNILPVKYLITKFAKNKSNLFIFPEGNNSIYKNKSLNEKFQLGTAKIIMRILDLKPSVKIVPLGLSYDSAKNSMGNIHIGDEIILKKTGNRIVNTTSDACERDLGQSGCKTTVKNITECLCSNLEKSVKLSRNQ